MRRMIHVVLPILFAGVMPILISGLSKVGAFSRADNHNTREWQTKLQGWRKRAYWAHQNALETLPHFMAAVICAHLASPGNKVAAGLAWGYIGLRAVYAYFYINDRASLRSLAWLASMLAILGLFVVALSA